MRPIEGDTSAGFELVDLPFADVPDRAGWLARQQSDDVYIRRHATLMLDRLNRDGTLERAHAEPIQVWRLGALTLVALGGEVVTDYALRLKREHSSARLWVAAYCNDVSCYIPSGRVLQEGGYEGGGAMIYYGRPGPFDPSVEGRIITTAGAAHAPAWRFLMARPLSRRRFLGAVAGGAAIARVSHAHGAARIRR